MFVAPRPGRRSRRPRGVRAAPAAALTSNAAGRGVDRRC